MKLPTKLSLKKFHNTYWVIKTSILFSIAALVLLILLFRGRMPNITELKEAVQAVAVIIGGIWTYYLFIRNRKDFPYATISHDVSHWKIREDKKFLSLGIKVTNSSNVVLHLVDAKIFVQQILPFSEHFSELIDQSTSTDLREGNVTKLFQRAGPIEWPEIGYREVLWKVGEIEIEPGENEYFHFDFILEKDVQVLKIISYFGNQSRKIAGGWVFTSFYNLEEKDMSDEHNKLTKSDRITESQSVPKRTPSIEQSNDLSQPPPIRTAVASIVSSQEKGKDTPPSKPQPAPEKSPASTPGTEIRSQPEPQRTEPPPKKTS